MSSRKKRKKEKEKNIRNSASKKERKKERRIVAGSRGRWNFRKVASMMTWTDHETGQDARIHEGDAYRPYVNTEKGR